MAETSTIFGFMKYVSATDILSDFKKTVDSYFVNNLRQYAQNMSILPFLANSSNSKSSLYHIHSP